MTTLVLTLLGRDKPGLVEAISSAASRHGANWEASKMARLGGRFTGLLLMTSPPHEASELQAELEALSELGLKVMVERVDEADPPREGFRALRLELVGTDRPGIMRDVSSVLTRLGVNVDELATQCEAAPMGGGTLFRMEARLACPASVSAETLEREVERLENDLMADISLDSVETVTT